MKSTKKETPFKLLHEFLKTIDSSFTQETIADMLGVTKDTVKNWSSGKQRIRDVNSLFYSLFSNKTPINKENFLRHLQNRGYAIYYVFFTSLVENDNNFIAFLGDFLAGNLKRLENTTSSDEPMTPKDRARLQKKDSSAPVNYFEQLIYKENSEECLLIISPSHDQMAVDFCKIDDLERILIVAPGGQGKSLFLRMLEEKALENKRNEGHYENIIRIELTDLFALSANEVVADSKEGHILGHLIKYESNNDEYKTFLKKKEKNPSNDTNGRILLLLDGLNELSASSDFKMVNTILNELEYINRNWTNTTIVMTTRPAKENKRILNGYCHCKLSGTPQEKLTAFLLSN